MPKPLKAIIGTRKSTVTKLTLGKQPGVDYQPKSPAEQDFVAQHEVEKHEDRNGNGDDVFKGKTKYVLDAENKHGHKKPVDAVKYDQVKEDNSCGNSLKTIRNRLKEIAVVGATPGNRAPNLSVSATNGKNV